MIERDIQALVQLELSRLQFTAFRNNTAQGWAGTVISRNGLNTVLASARPLYAGLCKGSSDLIGWRSILITPEMIGRKIAVFSAIEVKSHSGRATLEQQNFLSRVRDAGGIAFIARDPSAVAGGFSEWIQRK